MLQCLERKMKMSTGVVERETDYLFSPYNIGTCKETTIPLLNFCKFDFK